MNINEVKKELDANPYLNSFSDMISSIVELFDNEAFQNPTKEEINLIGEIFLQKMSSDREQLIDQLKIGFKYKKMTHQQAVDGSKELVNQLTDFINKIENNPVKELLNVIFNEINEITLEAAEQYLNYEFILPIKLGEGAQIPTYAHSTDAAADLYAAEDITIPAHSFSNLIPTNVHIALPEGWLAMILPRSSIGMKTCLRLSNSVGVIDSEYRGPLGVIYDNFSDSDYEVKKGERIAQMLIFPAYHFKPNPVDILSETERGEGSYGSTGK